MKNFVKRDEIYLPPACQYNALNVIDKYYVKWHRETADTSKFQQGINEQLLKVSNREVNSFSKLQKQPKGAGGGEGRGIYQSSTWPPCTPEG